jgi:serine/threonine/tyrosine-interacting protein
MSYPIPQKNFYDHLYVGGSPRLDPGTDSATQLQQSIGHVSTARGLVDGVAPASAYTSGTPSLPKFQVAAASSEFKMERECLDAAVNDSVAFASLDIDGITFLHRVTRGQTISNSDQFGIGSELWQYENRRHAQEVMPYLYLGPRGAAKDHDFLVKEGITMLLAIRDLMSVHHRFLDGSKIAGELRIAYQSVDVGGNQGLIAAFPRVVEVVNDHLQAVYAAVESGTSKYQYGKVLVYCESGNERSAAAVTAYLMSMYPIDLPKALQFTTMHRFCVYYDDGMKRLLQTYYEMLEAKRQIKHHGRQTLLHTTACISPSSPSLQVENYTTFGGIMPSSNAKRGREVDDDMEIDEHDDDIERFQDRNTFQPFVESTTTAQTFAG